MNDNAQHIDLLLVCLRQGTKQSCSQTREVLLLTVHVLKGALSMLHV